MSTNTSANTDTNLNNNRAQKVLLALLPYWTPQIPAMGIACLKSFLQSHGYPVAIRDVNTCEEFRSLYDRYFDILRRSVAEKKRGNFYNIGHEVLQNHMMAHLHYTDKDAYFDLIKEIVYKQYYSRIDDPEVEAMEQEVIEFFKRLESYILDLIDKESPDLMGLSVYKGNVPASMFAFRVVRKHAPHIKTVMGGPVFGQNLGIGTPNLDAFLEKTAGYIDHLLIGEGELLFLELLRGQLPEDRRVHTLAHIDNRVLDLDTAPLPDYSDLDIPFYPNLAVYGSRSCPFQCAFCSETVYWQKYRKKTPARIADQLEHLYNTYRRQLFLMCDSLLNPVITGLSNEIIRRDISIYWDGYLRIDAHACNPDTVLTWRRGGFYRARLGVESGSPDTLERMGKKLSIDSIKEALAALANAGIKTTTYWIIGYPGETEEDFQKTLDLIEEVRDHIYEAECNPFGYYLTGQVNSDGWHEKSALLYPESAKDMLVLQSYVLDIPPAREETYRRVARFTAHVRELGIANPYSMYDIYQADSRWKKLHPNAVPPLAQFKEKDNYIDEHKHLKKLTTATETHREEMTFGF